MSDIGKCLISAVVIYVLYIVGLTVCSILYNRKESRKWADLFKKEGRDD